MRRCLVPIIAVFAIGAAPATVAPVQLSPGRWQETSTSRLTALGDMIDSIDEKDRVTRKTDFYCVSGKLADPRVYFLVKKDKNCPAPISRIADGLVELNVRCREGRGGMSTMLTGNYAAASYHLTGTMHGTLGRGGRMEMTSTVDIRGQHVGSCQGDEIAR